LRSLNSVASKILSTVDGAQIFADCGSFMDASLIGLEKWEFVSSGHLLVFFRFSEFISDLHVLNVLSGESIDYSDTGDERVDWIKSVEFHFKK